MDATDARALADIDAIGQAALVAAGQLSAAELLEAAIIRLEAARDLNAVIADLFERGRAQAAALDASGSARRGQAAGGSSLPAQGSWASLAGTPEAMGSRALRTHVATERPGSSSATCRRGSGDLRQDQHPRMGQPLHHRAVAVRSDGQPVVAIDHPGRVQRGIGRRGRRRRRARGVGRRRHRLDPGARVVLRTRRPQTAPRPNLVRAWRPGTPRRPGQRSTLSPAPCATAPHCSTSSRARAPGDPYSAPAPSVGFPGCDRQSTCCTTSS